MSRKTKNSRSIRLAVRKRSGFIAPPLGVCNACVVKSRCTNSKSGRHIRRSFFQDILDQATAYRHTFAYQKAMRKRQVWIEPLFGEAKQWHGLRHFRLRRLPQVNIQNLIIAAGQNLKRLLATNGWGKRWFPSGNSSALDFPTAFLFVLRQIAIFLRLLSPLYSNNLYFDYQAN